MAADSERFAQLTVDPESGDIIHILSVFTGEKSDKIEQLLQTGITPWELAKDYGVLNELRDTLLERVLTHLDQMVESNYITREDADDAIACFEMNIPDGE